MLKAPIKHIAIIGSGNTANVLAHLFLKHNYTIDSIYSRNTETGKALANTVNAEFYPTYTFKNTTQLIVICTPDSAIAQVANLLPQSNALICHCSGSTPLSVLHQFKNYGVLYPLQTLSKNTENIALNIPFLIETNSLENNKALIQMVKNTGNNYALENSEMRMQYHLAAVFANNFSNAMFIAAQQILNSKQLNFEIIKPLIAQTASKINHNLPTNTQTGPAKRGDTITIQKHLELLKNYTQLKEIYALISNYIETNNES